MRGMFPFFYCFGHPCVGPFPRGPYFVSSLFRALDCSCSSLLLDLFRMCGRGARGPASALHIGARSFGRAAGQRTFELCFARQETDSKARATSTFMSTQRLRMDSNMTFCKITSRTADPR